MILRELLVERYAILHNLKDRSVELFACSLDRFADFLGREPEVSDLDDLTVSQFLRWRAKTPHRGRIPAPATVRKDQAHLVSLWNHAARKRLAGKNGQPVDFPDLSRNIVKVPQHVKRGYTVEEVSALVKAARERVRKIGPVPGDWFFATLIQAAWYTGARIGALLAVEWQDIDWERGTMTFRGEHSKGGVKTLIRQIPASLLEELRSGRRAPTERVWPWNDYRVGQTSIGTALTMICWTADVKPRGFHAIRRASGSYVAAAGGDASEHLAHSNPKTTRDHYLDPTIVRQSSALDFLPPLNLD